MRIFISSPGDVAEERVLANKLVRRLQEEFADRARIEPVFWEHEPLLATGTFQKADPAAGGLRDGGLHSLGPAGHAAARGHLSPRRQRLCLGNGIRIRGRRRTATAGTASPNCWSIARPPGPSWTWTMSRPCSALDQKQALDRFVQQWFFDRTDGTLKAAFHRFELSSQFEQVLEEHLRKLIQRQLPTPEALSQRLSGLPGQGSPFRGLDVFESEHAAIFFGRSQATGEVLNALRKNAAEGRAFVMVLGISGGGKSSLVRAGVVPLLMQPGVIEKVGLWRQAVLRPSDSPDGLFPGLARALLRPEALAGTVCRWHHSPAIGAVAAQNPGAASILVKGGLSQAAAECAAREKLEHQPDARLVLAVDQMEEIFTLENVSAGDRIAFVEALSALAQESARLGRLHAAERFLSALRGASRPGRSERRERPIRPDAADAG